MIPSAPSKEEGATQMQSILMEIILWGVNKAVDNSANLDVPDSAIVISITQRKPLGKELRIDAEWEAMQDKQLHHV